MAKAVVFAFAFGLIGTILWAVIDARTAPLIPAGLSLPLSMAAGIIFVAASFEWSLRRWDMMEDKPDPAEREPDMSNAMISTNEEEAVAKAIFEALQQNLPPGSNWRACIRAARAAIDAVDQHRQECGLVSVSKTRLEDLRSRVREVLARPS